LEKFSSSSYAKLIKDHANEVYGEVVAQLHYSSQQQVEVQVSIAVPIEKKRPAGPI
jgi:hypothetical protein